MEDLLNSYHLPSSADVRVTSDNVAVTLYRYLDDKKSMDDAIYGLNCMLPTLQKLSDIARVYRQISFGEAYQYVPKCYYGMLFRALLRTRLFPVLKRVKQMSHFPSVAVPMLEQWVLDSEAYLRQSWDSLCLQQRDAEKNSNSMARVLTIFAKAEVLHSVGLHIDAYDTLCQCITSQPRKELAGSSLCSILLLRIVDISSAAFLYATPSAKDTALSLQNQTGLYSFDSGMPSNVQSAANTDTKPYIAEYYKNGFAPLLKIFKRLIGTTSQVPTLYYSMCQAVLLQAKYAGCLKPLSLTEITEHLYAMPSITDVPIVESLCAIVTRFCMQDEVSCSILPYLSLAWRGTSSDAYRQMNPDLYVEFPSVPLSVSDVFPSIQQANEIQSWEYLCIQTQLTSASLSDAIDGCIQQNAPLFTQVSELLPKIADMKLAPNRYVYRQEHPFHPWNATLPITNQCHSLLLCLVNTNGVPFLPKQILQYDILLYLHHCIHQIMLLFPSIGVDLLQKLTQLPESVLYAAMKSKKLESTPMLLQLKQNGNVIVTGDTNGSVQPATHTDATLVLETSANVMQHYHATLANQTLHMLQHGYANPKSMNSADTEMQSGSMKSDNQLEARIHNMLNCENRSKTPIIIDVPRIMEISKIPF